jgi:hypothetical protein
MPQHPVANGAAAPRTGSVAQFRERLNSPSLDGIHHRFFGDIQASTDHGFLAVNSRAMISLAGQFHCQISGGLQQAGELTAGPLR